MQKLSAETKFAHLGKPGTAFSKGFERRLNILKNLIDFHDKKILDEGTGEGVWLAEFAKLTRPENVYASEYDPELVAQIRNQKSETRNGVPAENIKNCPAEKLDFPDNFFDIVFTNEVMEHVQDDQLAAQEAIRVLKPGGKFIIFTPNRGWPFETHGMFWRGNYYWGNIPLLPWLPKSIARKFAPHVRNYSNAEIERLFKNLPAKIIYHKHVFPGFDGLTRKFGILGKAVQKFFLVLEKTPLHFFGISHLLIVEKT
jgi:ubiquinone/menaquinone biosynthesis C-methylase UbiE